MMRIPLRLLVTTAAAAANTSFKEAVRAFERAQVSRALLRSRHNQKKAAALLGLSYDQFRGLYRKYRDELQVGRLDRAGLLSG